MSSGLLTQSRVESAADIRHVARVQTSPSSQGNRRAMTSSMLPLLVNLERPFGRSESQMTASTANEVQRTGIRIGPCSFAPARMWAVDVDTDHAGIPLLALHARSTLATHASSVALELDNGPFLF